MTISPFTIWSGIRLLLATNIGIECQYLQKSAVTIINHGASIQGLYRNKNYYHIYNANPFDIASNGQKVKQTAFCNIRQLQPDV
jgi:hypothetical protein